MSISYFNLLKKSLTNFKENLSILFPILLNLLFSLLFVSFLALQFFIGLYLFKRTGTFAFSPVLYVLGSIFIVLDLLVGVFWAAYYKSMFAGMLKSITVKGRTSVDDIWGEGRKYFRKFLLYILATSCIILLPLVALGAITGISFLVSKMFGIFIAILLFSLFILYAFFISLCLFFADVMLVSEKTSVKDTITHSFRYLFRKPEAVFITWGISLVVAMALGLASVIVTFPIQMFGQLFLPLIITAAAFRVALNLVLNIYLNIFKFNSYFASNPEKRH